MSDQGALPEWSVKAAEDLGYRKYGSGGHLTVPRLITRLEAARIIASYANAAMLSMRRLDILAEREQELEAVFSAACWVCRRHPDTPLPHVGCAPLRAAVEALRLETVKAIDTLASHAPQGVRDNRETLEKVRDALDIAWKLSTWAATIRWSCYERNQPEWLSGLKERIEAYQATHPAALSALDRLMGGESGSAQPKEGNRG